MSLLYCMLSLKGSFWLSKKPEQCPQVPSQSHPSLFPASSHQNMVTSDSKKQDGDIVHKPMGDIAATMFTSSIQSVLQSCDFNHCAISPVVWHIAHNRCCTSWTVPLNLMRTVLTSRLLQPNQLLNTGFIYLPACLLKLWPFSNEMYDKTNNLSHWTPDQ